MSATEQVLIHELNAIAVQINNADSFFREAALNHEVDPMALYELREADGKEKTRLIEEAYTKFSPKK